MKVFLLRDLLQNNGKIAFKESGDVYEGELDEFKMQGQGVMKYANGDVYDGWWEGGIKHGYGTIKYANDNMYIGKWMYDKRSGLGKEVLIDKQEYYEGNFMLDTVWF